MPALILARGAHRSNGHSDIASTVRYVGIEVDDALEVCEQLKI